jgi:signal transduction histidine kinase
LFAVTLSGVSVLFSAMLYEYFYGTVQNRLESYSGEVVSNFFDSYVGLTDEKFMEGAVEFVRTNGIAQNVEIWVVDKNGNVVISSSGAYVGEDVSMPDYDKAVASGSGSGTGLWRGRFSETGERVMCYTSLISSGKGGSGAVRYIVSLQDIDRQYTVLLLLIFLVVLILLGFFILSGNYFIRSILRPVAKVGETAQRIAEGDFSARIDKSRYNDEIGKLCETINDMAQELDIAQHLKNDFISTVSHELRTPLTAIRGWGETLMQTGLSDEVILNQGLRCMVDESARLSGLVEDLLDFSLMQSGQFRLRIEKIDVLAELDDVMFVFKERAVRDGITFEYTASDFPAPMNGDAARIRQVFVNVLDNAFKYTETGGFVTVNAEIRDTMLCVTVADTGCGIAPDALPHVKEKFYKSNISVSGSGIGLAVCDEIMARHGGTLEIESELHVGTTVRVTFTIDAVERPDAPTLQDLVAREIQK